MTESYPIDHEARVSEVAYEVAIQAAQAASVETLRYWNNPTNPYFDPHATLFVTDKAEGVGNFVTAADLSSDRIISDALDAEPLLAGHRRITEESDPIETDSACQWVVDSIDGTIPFKSGLKDWGISIGMLKGDEPEVGVVALPAQGLLLAARRGYGAHLFDLAGNLIADLSAQPERPTPPDDKLVIAYDLGYTDRKRQLDVHVKQVVERVAYATSYCSSSASNMYVAQGLLDGFFSETPTKFDIAAAAAIVQEMGGVVTGMDGQSIDWNADKRTFLAARTPAIHARLVAMLNSSQR